MAYLYLCLSCECKHGIRDVASRTCDTSSSADSRGKPTAHHCDQSGMSADSIRSSLLPEHRRPSESITVSATRSIRLTYWLSISPDKRTRQAVTPAYAVFMQLKIAPQTLRLLCISPVYATERAQVAEGQDSKWPDESVTLGKFHSRNGGGSEMSAGKFVLIALTQTDNVRRSREIGGRRPDCRCRES